MLEQKADWYLAWEWLAPSCWFLVRRMRRDDLCLSQAETRENPRNSFDLAIARELDLIEAVSYCIL